jgi:hypothetical protein
VSVLRQIVPFVLSAVLTVSAFHLRFPDYSSYGESPIHRHLAYIEACRERGEEIDLLLVGSSLAIATVHMPLLEELVRESGHEGFNALTVGATSFDVQGNNRLLREALKGGMPGLDVVMMESTLFPLYYPKPSQSRTAPYLWLYSDPRETLAAVGGILQSEATLQEKLERIWLVQGHFSSEMLGFNFVGAFSDRKAGGASIDDGVFALSGGIGESRGHAPTIGHSPPFTPERWAKFFRHFRKQTAEAEASASRPHFSTAVSTYPFEMAEKHGFDLIVLFTPSALVTTHEEEYRELSEVYAKEGVRSEIWDYNDPSDPKVLSYMQYDQRWDPIHLNQSGERFTRGLAERLIRFLDENDPEGANR